MPLLRSMLFTPGNNMRMIVKATERGADAVIFDMEDSVPMSDKETARLFVRDALRELGLHSSITFVRINAFDTDLAETDLDWVVQRGLDGIMLPKAETADDIHDLVGELERLEAESDRTSGMLRVVPLIETARGVMNAYEVATASPRIVGLAFGGVDFTRDMGVDLTAEGHELWYARSHIAVVARAAGVLAIDTPCIAVRDKQKLATETRMVKELGFKGKLLIHPAQVPTVNDIFSPTTEEIARAARIVDAFDEAQEQGLGAISLDGKMIDVANYQQAKDLLDIAHTIEERAAEATEPEEIPLPKRVPVDI